MTGDVVMKVFQMSNNGYRANVSWVLTGLRTLTHL